MRLDGWPYKWAKAAHPACVLQLFLRDEVSESGVLFEALLQTAATHSTERTENTMSTIIRYTAVHPPGWLSNGGSIYSHLREGTCQNCGKTWQSVSPKKKFCTDRCRLIAANEKTKKARKKK